jgi:prefoldin subunit 5
MNEKLMELKAKAYDVLAMVEAWQRELQSINAQIAEVQKAINETKQDAPNRDKDQ